MKIKKALFTFIMLLVSAQLSFAFTGQGNESSPYLINNENDWSVFANNVTSGQGYSGKYFKLMADLKTSVMAGKMKSGDNAFKGTFDGNNHTIYFEYDAGNRDYDVALFRSINGATIKNLHTTGLISIGTDHAAGIACRVYGNCTISSCRSDITINASSGGVYAGIACQLDNSARLTLTDVLFDGCILGPSAEQCAGFVGYTAVNNSITFNNCLYAPGLHTISNVSGFGRNGTFYRTAATTQTLNNCYYTQALGDAQGTYVEESELRYISFRLKLGDGWENISDVNIPLPKGASNGTLKGGYAVYNSDDKTITFFGDGNEAAHTASNEKVYPLPFRRQEPKWFAHFYEMEHVVFDPSFSLSHPVTCDEWFYFSTRVKDIKGLENLNTNIACSMKSMFSYCSLLTQIDLSHFNTTNVTNMSYMFENCSALETLDMHTFNTSNVTSMNNMFRYCKTLSSLDLSMFDTRKVTNMEAMFDGCNALESVDISSFKTQNVKSMSNMFSNCEQLSSLNVSHFDTSAVEEMDAMFFGTTNLATLDLTSFNTKEVTTMSQMFSNSMVTLLDLSSFNTSKVKKMYQMFLGCTNLTSIYAGSGWTMDAVEDSRSMFSDIENIVGSSGTTYDENQTNGNYAHIDGGSSNPGYLSTALTKVTLADNADNTPVLVEGTSPCKVVLQGRTLHKDGSWNTLCLPFDLSIASSELHDAEVMSLEGASFVRGTLELNFTPVTTTLEAGKPYIVRWTTGTNITNPTFLGVTLSPADNPVNLNNIISFQGTYSPKSLPADDTPILYLGDDNKLYHPESGITLKACRAYFQLADIFTFPSYLGDLNNDGTVTVTDVMILVNYCLGLENDDFDISKADINSDGSVGVNDVMALVDVILLGGTDGKKVLKDIDAGEAGIIYGGSGDGTSGQGGAARAPRH